MNLAETDVEARSIIWRMFRDAADEDYLMARAAFRQKLPYQFFWNAQQALEKYLKCALILNGGKDENFKHRLLPIWQRMELVAPELLPLVLCPPYYFPDDARPIYGRFELAANFISRVESRGDPNNRYRTYSTTVDWYDLHKFDEMCFQIRRTAFPLDMPYELAGKKYRDALKASPNWQQHSFGFLRKPNSEEYKLRYEAFSWRNFSFCEDIAVAEGVISTGSSSINAALYLACVRATQTKAALEWAMSKMYLTKSDKEYLRQVIAKKQ